MDESQPISPRARLQQLLAIPERQRTDAEWDELNELEISLASALREGAPQNARGGNAPAQGGQARPGGRPNQDRKGQRRFHHQRPPKPR